MLNNRIDAGLRWIAAAQLVDLVGDRLYGYDEFGEWQTAHLARQAATIAVRCALLCAKVLSHEPAERLAGPTRPTKCVRHGRLD